MVDFIKYVVSELKSKRLSKADSVALIKQFSGARGAGMAMGRLNPLLHVNTSDFHQQSYDCFFNGTEPFLADHQVNGQKVLPAVAYIEIARCAVEHALAVDVENFEIVMQNLVWVTPLVVEHKTGITTLLYRNEQAAQELDFELVSLVDRQETVHFKGSASVQSRTGGTQEHFDKLRAGMVEVSTIDLYDRFGETGMLFGPCHRSVNALYLGEDGGVAWLRSTDDAIENFSAYGFFPGLIDGAMQAAAALVMQGDLFNGALALPFALEKLTVRGKCSANMYAWIRLRKANDVHKLDMDLCTVDGGVCMEFRGLMMRSIQEDRRKPVNFPQGHETGLVIAKTVWQKDSPEKSDFDKKVDFNIHHRILVGSQVFLDKHTDETGNRVHSMHIAVADNMDAAERYFSVAGKLFDYIKGVFENKTPAKTLVQIVIEDSEENQLLCGVAALLKTATLEDPYVHGQLIFLSEDITGATLLEVLSECSAASGQKIWKCSAKGRSYLAFERASLQVQGSNSVFKNTGVYLITGGMGGLGRIFARHILQTTTNTTVILSGRASLDEAVLVREFSDILPEVKNINSRLAYIRLNLESFSDVSTVVTGLLEKYQTLSGILHCAGMVIDNFIVRKSAEEFARVLSPKVSGTWNLDLATRELNLDFFALFSSASSTFGNIGQADYAVANGFLDSFAHYRNVQRNRGRRKGKTVAINWPLWREGGMQVDPGRLKLMQAHSGMFPLTTATGVQVFQDILLSSDDQVLVFEGEQARIEEFVFAETNGSDICVDSVGQSLIEAPVADRDDLLEGTTLFLREQFSLTSKIPVARIDSKAPLEKYGVDSILAMTFITQLEKSFGSLSKTLLFEYQSLQDLAGYFVKSFAPILQTLVTSNSAIAQERVQHPTRANTDVARATRPTKSSGRSPASSLNKPRAGNEQAMHEAIAIVGLSGRYPGAFDVKAYWENLRSGKDCITEVPASRWKWQDYYSADRTVAGKHYSKWGGFIEGVDEFDPRFFNISPLEAESLDPQERLFLEHAWQAVEDAGYTRETLHAPGASRLVAQVGVYAGVMYGEYNLSGSLAGIANRVSYFMNLHGPSITLDTMCSSSLTAIHLACLDLKSHRTDFGIAGGVNVSIEPNKYHALSAGQFISSDGHCQSFGEGGDGYIPGEGVGVVLLKRLSDAERDRDHIYGVIKATSINHGGKTNGVTVPNPKAQAEVIRQAFSQTDINPRQISYLEAHGTGTRLGDPIEITALSTAFQTDDKQFCLLGSAKSNIGHCESAAGIAGLTKVLLQMRHREIVPSLHSSNLNPHIDFANSPFIVNQTLTSWNRPLVNGVEQLRTAGISSFGAGGSNAHILVQEYEPNQKERKEYVKFYPHSMVAIILSARTDTQLKQKVAELLVWLNQENVRDKGALIDIAYTLQLGREPMAERLALLASSAEELKTKLQSWLQDESGLHQVFRGNVGANRETFAVFSEDRELQEAVAKWLEKGKFTNLLELWAKGLEVDWLKLYQDSLPQRVSLPVYPFAREHYWLKRFRGVALAYGESLKKAVGNANNVLHPLLHRNISRFDAPCFSTSFTADITLAGQKILGETETAEPVLSVAIYLEMIRAATGVSLADGVMSTGIAIRNISTGVPFQLDANREALLALFQLEEEWVDVELYSLPLSEKINAADALLEQVHCQAQVRQVRDLHSNRADINEIKQRLTHALAVDSVSVYQNFLSLGLDYLPQWQVLNKVIVKDNGLLAELTIREGSIPGCVFKPELLDGALQAAAILLGEAYAANGYAQTLPGLPQSIDEALLLRACTGNVYLRVDLAEESETAETLPKLSVILFDDQGEIIAELRGLNYRKIKPGAYKEEKIKHSENSLSIIHDATQREPEIQYVHRVVLSADQQIPEPNKNSRVKPSAIILSGVNDNWMSRAYSSQRNAKPILPALALPDTIGGVDFATTPASISITRLPHDIYQVKFESVFDSGMTEEFIAQLNGILDQLAAAQDIKLLILAGDDTGFLQGHAKAHNLCISTGLYKKLASFPWPVIAQLNGATLGAGVLLALVCDFVVCADSSKLSCAGTQTGLVADASIFDLVAHRWGACKANNFLFGELYADNVRESTSLWGFSLVPQGQINAVVKELSEKLATKPARALSLLKSHLVTGLLTKVEALEQLTQEPKDAPQVLDEATLARLSLFGQRAQNVEIKIVQEQAIFLEFRSEQAAGGLQNSLAEFKEFCDLVEESTTAPSIFLTLREFTNYSTHDDALIRAIATWLSNTSRHVVAVLTDNIDIYRWYLALLCDAIFCHKTVVFDSQFNPSFDDINKRISLAFIGRYGIGFGSQLLVSNEPINAEQLKTKDIQLVLSAQDEALQDIAIKVAKSARLAEAGVKFFRNYLRDYITNNSVLLTDIRMFESSEAEYNKDETIKLESSVVSASVKQGDILLVELRDQQSKNMFSEELIQGVIEVFKHLKNSSQYKAVILTGYDNYFASGGTREGLLAIQRGEVKFTDRKIYHLAMECKVPVIVAMQGHAIGAGWSLGMFGDFIFMGAENHYISPYMDFGFTPGAGSTFILPKKLGFDIAVESLLAARVFSGEELAGRGLQYPVLPRAQVLASAMRFAESLRQFSLPFLRMLKSVFVSDQMDTLENFYAQEVQMHDETFVGQTETLKNIESGFSQEEVGKPLANSRNASEYIARPQDIIDDLGGMLAHELRIAVDELNPQLQFVDLGLDSITGVTWIRKINDKFHLALESSVIYSHANLSSLANFIETKIRDKNNLSRIVAETTQETKSLNIAILNDSHLPSRDSVQHRLAELLAAEIRVAFSEIRDDLEFTELGVDSITGVSWVRKINEEYGTSIDSTKIYSYPTIVKFAAHLHSLLGAPPQTPLIEHPFKSANGTPPSAISRELAMQYQGRELQSRRKPLRTPKTLTQVSKDIVLSQQIAVIGMAGQFPRARNLEEFWDNIAQGRNCVDLVPENRWDITNIYQAGEASPGKTSSKWMGALDDYDKFDPLFFNISPKEARSMDPQQRLFLQACWTCIEDSGYASAQLSGTKCGVFVGCGAGDYQKLTGADKLSAPDFTGGAVSILTARISYLLDLHGPSLAIDTACSSSLVAIAQACDSLVAGNCDSALAGGVSIMATPEMQILTAQTGMLSPSGRCFTFDSSANGIVLGEGVGVIFLKRLEDARRDEDIIVGVIKGWGTNQDGKTNGITAPNPESQTRLQREVYKKFDINPAHIQLIEAHGTGTPLGDPIEVGALKESFAPYSTMRNYCALGSVKSNIGHCLAAAGVSGVLKVLLALKHRMLPPTINFSELNKHIRLDDSPFYVNTRLQEWPTHNSARCAAISSFGFSGTNAHLVIAENTSQTTGHEFNLVNDAQYLLPLSAKNMNRLKVKASELSAFIKRTSLTEVATSPRKLLSELCYTLQVGRDAMEARLCCIVSSLEELQQNLDAFIKMYQHAGLHIGEIKSTKENIKRLADLQKAKQREIDSCLQTTNFRKLAEFWTEGLNVDWRKLYGEKTPQRLNLPGYPFSRDRFWIDLLPATRSAATKAAFDAKHPLLHTMELQDGNYIFSSRFSGREFFLTDHVVNARKTLPGVACLEMAYAGIQQILAADTQSSIVLEHIVWSRPFTVAEQATSLYLKVTNSSPERWTFEIESLAADNTILRHCQGQAVLSGRIVAKTIEVNAIKDRCVRQRLSATDCYQRFKRIALDYGPFHQGIEQLFVGDGEVLGRLTLDEKLMDVEGRFTLHPGLTDAALQAAIGLLAEESGQAIVPFSLRKIMIFKACCNPMWVWVQSERSPSENNKIQNINLILTDNDGECCVEMSGLASRMMRSEGSPEKVSETLLIKPDWKVIENRKQVQHIEFDKRIIFLCGYPSRLQQELSSLTGVTILRIGSEANGSDKDFSLSARKLFDEVKAFLDENSKSRCLVQLVYPLKSSGLWYSSASAFFKTLVLEYSRLQAQVIGMDVSYRDEVIAQCIEDSLKYIDKAQLRFTDDVIYFESLTEVVPDQSESEAQLPWRQNGVYLITGGLGGLGVIFAREIATKSLNTTLVLAGRSRPGKSQTETLNELNSYGVRAVYRQVDIANTKETFDLIQSITEEYGSLNGILHCAGITHDNYLKNKSSAEFRSVLAPKVSGTINLDLASRQLDLDFIVFFSSIAGFMGNPGQTDYAFANSFMDVYAGLRNQAFKDNVCKGKTYSINWPLWKDGGMYIDSATADLMHERTGLVVIDTTRAMQAFYSTLNSQHNQLIVLEGRRAQLEKYFSLTPVTSTATTSSKELVSTEQKDLPTKDGRQMDTEVLVRKIESVLLEFTSQLLMIDVNNLDVDSELGDYGLDSIGFTEFANKLNRDFSLALTPTIFFEYSTLAEFARYLAAEYSSAFTGVFGLNQIKVSELQSLDVESSSRVQREQPVSVPVSGPNPVAIIGMSGKFPQAEDLHAFWKNLVEGRNCISEIPTNRWDWKQYYGDARKEANKTKVKWGGFIDGVDEFDSLFFGISPGEAKNMDPQQRLLMTFIWKVIEDAGYSSKSLAGSNTGIFVATANSGYSELVTLSGASIEGYSATGTVPSVGPNRMSFLLDLHGPSEPIETACSSSLVAIHRALQSIETGNCDMAIAGGVNTIVGPWAHISFSKAGMLAEDGKCKTFSSSANGYARGEGAGMLFLKRLDAAQKDGDFIYALIKGSAENHGGRANSLTAPNPLAQADLLQSAYKKAGVDPATLGYIEAHGTGTELGDPIEINALKTAFKNFRGAQAGNNSHYCGIGSVKSNIGHLELAAGIAGVIKVILQLQHKTLVKTLHCSSVNPYIDLAESPFYIVQENRNWEACRGQDGNPLPRRAGVSSFGFGGVNAHIVLEEYVTQSGMDRRRDKDEPFVFVLSAKTETALKDYVQSFVDYFARNPQLTAVDLENIVYTLQVGRDSMEERFGVIAESVTDISTKLQAWLLDGRMTNGVYRGNVSNIKSSPFDFSENGDLRDVVDQWVKKRRTKNILNLWVKGFNFSWERFYENEKPSRVSLPSYPFSRTKHWISGYEMYGQNVFQTVQELHPLLTKNTSNIARQKYQTIITRNNPFLIVENSARVLPFSVYLEMAYAAVKDAVHEVIEFKAIEFVDLVWVEPLNEIDEEKTLNISLSPNDRETNQIEFEIYSESQTNSDVVESLHFEGAARLQRFVHERRLNSSFLQDCISVAELERVGKTEVYIKLLSLSKVSSFKETCVIHPELISELFSLCARMYAENTAVLAPLSLESLTIFGVCQGELYARLELIEEIQTQNADTCVFNIDLITSDGRVAISFNRLVFELPQRNYLERLNHTGKLWISIVEQWVAMPLNDSEHLWDQRLAAKKNHEICIISSSQQYSQALESFCHQLSEAANSKQGLWAITHLPLLINGTLEPDSYRFQTALKQSSHPCAVVIVVDNLDADKLLHMMFNIVKTLLAYASDRDISCYFWAPFKQGEDQLYMDALSGLFKTAAIENRKHKYRTVFFDQETGLQVLPVKIIQEWLCDDLSSATAEQLSMVRINDGNRLVSRNLDLSEYDVQDPPISFKHGASYLMIGALGDVGELICQQLGKHYQAKLIILSRRTADQVSKKLERIRASGAEVHYFSTDILNLQQLESVFDQLYKEGLIINGVFHMARNIENALIVDREFSCFSRTMAAKIQGTLNIDKCLANQHLDFFMMYSSMAAFGLRGAADYSYSTAFQNAFSRYRNELVSKGKRKGRTLSICWGQWEVDGCVDAHKLPGRLASMKRIGLDTIDASSAMTIMDLGLNTAYDVVGFVAVHDIDMVKNTQNSEIQGNTLQEIESAIDEFSSRRMSKARFIEILKSFESVVLPGSLQKRIIQSIKRHHREIAGRSSLQLSPELPALPRGPVVLAMALVDKAVNDSNPTHIPGSNGSVLNDGIHTEKLIVKNIKRVLGIEESLIKPDKSFQEYGLDSITAIQLTSALEKELGINVQPGWLVEYSTLSRLSGKLYEESKKGVRI